MHEGKKNTPYGYRVMPKEGHAIVRKLCEIPGNTNAQPPKEMEARRENGAQHRTKGLSTKFEGAFT